jgi:hypothetical protein
MRRRSRDLRPRGSPPITRITLPTCCSHYPDGSNGCMCRLLPRPPGLPRCSGGSASMSSLSRPAQALLTLRPVGSLNRPKAAFVTRLRPSQSPSQTARQLPDQSTTLWVESSSTGDTHFRNARNIYRTSSPRQSRNRWVFLGETRRRAQEAGGRAPASAKASFGIDRRYPQSAGRQSSSTGRLFEAGLPGHPGQGKACRNPR